MRSPSLVSTRPLHSPRSFVGMLCTEGPEYQSELLYFLSTQYGHSPSRTVQYIHLLQLTSSGAQLPYTTLKLHIMSRNSGSSKGLLAVSKSGGPKASGVSTDKRTDSVTVKILPIFGSTDNSFTLEHKAKYRVSGNVTIGSSSWRTIGAAFQQVRQEFSDSEEPDETTAMRMTREAAQSLNTGSLPANVKVQRVTGTLYDSYNVTGRWRDVPSDSCICEISV